MNANDRRRLQQTVIRTENTPQGLVAPARTLRNIHAPEQEWAYNSTGYELFDGYIVAVTDFDPTDNRYTIARPTADNMPNIAVVKSSYCANSSTARVELQFSGVTSLYYSGTAPTVANTLGSQSGSFYAKIGSTGFAPVETGATVGGFGRCRSRFFSSQTCQPTKCEYNAQGFYGTTTTTSGNYGYLYGTWNSLLEYGSTTGVNLDAGKKYFLTYDTGFLSAYGEQSITLSDLQPRSFNLYMYVDFADSSENVIATGVVCVAEGGVGQTDVSGSVSVIGAAIAYGAFIEPVSSGVATKLRIWFKATTAWGELYCQYDKQISDYVYLWSI